MVRYSMFALCLFATAAIGQEECKAIIPDSDRLACYDAAHGVEVMAQPRLGIRGKWDITTNRSPMTDEKSVFMSLESEDEIRGKFGTPGPATMMLRCKENTTSAFFVFNGLFMSDLQGRGRIEYRIDQAKMASILADVSNNHEALGLWGGGRSIPWIKKLFGKEKLVIRATPFSDSSVTATFDIRETEAAVAGLREACGW